MRIASLLVVFGASLISGGFAIPLGFALGLSGLEVYGASVVGSIAGLMVGLFAGDKLRRFIQRTRGLPELDPESRVMKVVDRHGAKGLGLVGPIFPGVTASAFIGLALGLDRRQLAIWLSLGTAVLFAVYTVGLWALIELIAVE